MLIISFFETNYQLSIIFGFDNQSVFNLSAIVHYLLSVIKLYKARRSRRSVLKQLGVSHVKKPLKLFEIPYDNSSFLFTLGPCQLCAPGSFTNQSNSIECSCCPSGSSSTYEKTTCYPCHLKEYSTGNCSMCQSCIPPGSCKLKCCFLYKLLQKIQILSKSTFS